MLAWLWLKSKNRDSFKQQRCSIREPDFEQTILRYALYSNTVTKEMNKFLLVVARGWDALADDFRQPNCCVIAFGNRAFLGRDARHYGTYDQHLFMLVSWYIP